MKAFSINRLDGPHNGAINDWIPPRPDVDSISVRIKAAGVNPLDLQILAGSMEAVFPVPLPYIPGTDFSGIVEATGSNVTHLQPGDRVVGRTDPTAGGAFAQMVTINAEQLCKIDDVMSFEQAAALPTAYGAARLALLDIAGLHSGQRVLIHAGAGGVGSFAIQIAKQTGAYVVATASASNGPLLTELGADEIIDYRTQDFTQLNGIDVVLDTIGGDTLERSWDVLSESGRIVTLTDFSIAPRGSQNGEFVFFKDAAPTLPHAIESFSKGQLQIVMDRIYDLDDTRMALEKVATGHARGKVTIRT